MNLLGYFENGKGFVLVMLNSIVLRRDVKKIKRSLSLIGAGSDKPILLKGYYEWSNGERLHRRSKEYILIIPVSHAALIGEELAICAPFGQTRYYEEDVADEVPHALYWFLNDLAGANGDPEDLNHRRMYGTYGGVDDEVYIFVGEHLVWYAKLIK